MYTLGMSSADLARMALELPPEERLDLARRLVESVVAPASLNEAILEGIRRLEDLATGRVQGLTEEEFRAALLK
jgi:putative addiction module component (TIGR02574 family)